MKQFKSEINHEAVSEMCWGRTRLERLLPRSWQWPTVEWPLVGWQRLNWNKIVQIILFIFLIEGRISFQQSSIYERQIDHIKTFYSIFTMLAAKLAALPNDYI